MTKWSTRSTLAVGLGLFALLAACSGTDESDPDARKTPSGSTSAGPGSGSPAVVKALWEWEAVGNPVGPGVEGAAEADETHVLDPEDGPRVNTRASGTTVTSLRVPRPLGLATGIVDSPWVVWTANSEGLPIRIKGFADNLTTGEHRTFDPPISEFGLVEFVDDLAIYATVDQQNRDCLATWNLTTDQVALSACREGKEINIELVQSRYGAAVTTARPNGRGGCRELEITRNPDARHPRWRPVDLRRKCTAMTGVAAADFIAWDEIRGRVDEDEAMLFARTPDGTTTKLGRAGAATVRACGDWIYWTSYASYGESVELRRWRPGEDQEIIYKGTENQVNTGPVCHDGVISMLRVTLGADAYREVLLEGHPPE